MSTRPTRSAAGRWKWIVRIAVAAAVLVLLWVYVDFGRVWDLLRKADVTWLAPAFVAMAFGNLLIAYRLNVLMSAVDVRADTWRVFQAYLKGHFIAYFFPSSISADVYKAIDIGRETRAAGAVTSAILMERALGLLSIAAIILAGASVTDVVVDRFGLGAGLTVAALAIVIGFFVLLQSDRLIQTARGLLPGTGGKVTGFLDGLVRALGLYRARIPSLAYAFLLSVLIQFGRGFTVWLVARSMGDDTAFGYFLAFTPLVFLLNTLPLAGSRLGFEQGSFVVLFGTVGMSQELALGTSLLYVAIGFLVALPGGYWLLRKG